MIFKIILWILFAIGISVAIDFIFGVSVLDLTRQVGEKLWP